MIFYEDTTIEDVLKTFEDFYVKKDYDNALQTLKKHGDALPKGLLHYNLGTVYSKLGDWGEARFHLLLAREQGLSSPELSLNTKLVEEKLEISRLEKPLNTTDYLVKGSLVAKEGFLTTLALLLLIGGLVVLRRNASLLKATLWTFLVATPVALNFWIDSWPLYFTGETAVVSDGPSAIFNERTELPEGIVVLLRGEGEWREVIYPSRFSGWVSSRGLRRLE